MLNVFKWSGKQVTQELNDLREKLRLESIRRYASECVFVRKIAEESREREKLEDRVDDLNRQITHLRLQLKEISASAEARLSDVEARVQHVIHTN